MVQRHHSNCITHITSSQANKLTSHEDVEKQLTSFQDLHFEPQLDRFIAINSITQNLHLNL